MNAQEIHIIVEGKEYLVPALPTWVDKLILLRETGKVYLAQSDKEISPPQPAKLELVPNKGVPEDMLKNSEAEAIFALVAQNLNAVIAVLVKE